MDHNSKVPATIGADGYRTRSYKIIDLNEVLEGFEALLACALRETIYLDCHVDHSLPPVFGEPAMLRQILLSLAGNAQDAMPSGGELFIEIMHYHLDNVEAGELGIPPGTTILFSVFDTGLGMDRQEAENLNAFFSGKDIRSGSIKSNLAAIHHIIAEHGGTIRICSEQHMGSIFKIFLPAVKFEVVE